ncbi:hypothetical protein OAL24_00487 [Oenococcus sicerae]|nr:hypothetical protein OAL24_00487 [Oenococcus sicerae]
MAKGLIAGIIATAAAYAAFKALPQAKQDELAVKAKEAGNKLKDLGYDAAYAGADLAGDLSEKAKDKVGEVDEQLKNSKYADTYQDVKDKAADIASQASPYLDKAKDTANDLIDKASPYADKAKDAVSPYLGKAKDTIDDLRQHFSKEAINLEEDDALKDDLTKPDEDEKTNN